MLARVLMVYAAGMFGVLLLPVGTLIGAVVMWLHGLGGAIGMPGFLTPRWYEFGLNMALFAVPAVLVVLLWPRVRRWLWLALALGLSVAVELIQGAALPRTADIVDVIANVSGAFLGLAAVAILGQPAAAADPADILLRDVPQDVRQRLEYRAWLQGQSLGSYLTDELVRIAGPSPGDHDAPDPRGS